MKTHLRTYLIPVIAVCTGLIIGKWLFSDKHTVTQQSAEVTTSEKEIWTCSMHPQIKQDHPGKCPLCAMDLIPLKPTATTGNDSTISLSEEAVALANIQTTTVQHQKAMASLRLYGTLQPDERLTQVITAHVNGRIEQLDLNYTGATVTKGQRLATIYSPEVYAVQQELREASRLASTQPAILEAAKEKLRLWLFSEAQIEALLHQSKPQPNLPIYARQTGIVVNRQIQQGDYVKQGQTLFTISDLSRLWALFEVYEPDLEKIHVGDSLLFSIQGQEDRPIHGKISFIDPVVNSATRTARVRVELANPNGRFKPGMFATAQWQSSVQHTPEGLVVPRSAVLWTGTRSVVYVKLPHTQSPTFVLRPVTLGGTVGDSYLVAAGLSAGEEIVTQGTFTIDAAAQLEGKPNMMTDSLPIMHINSQKHHMHSEPSHPMQMKTPPNIRTGNMLVKGMCESCQTRIEAAAKAVPGVSEASWSIETHQLHIRFDSHKTSLRKISKAVAAVGHDTPYDHASENRYNDLPTCCKYR